MELFRFYITDAYDVQTEVSEPEGWKDIEEVLDRDINAHGVFFELTDGDLTLGFACEGRHVLESIYQTDGIQGYCVYSVQKAADSISDYNEIYSAIIDFKTREYTPEMFRCQVHNSSTQLSFKSRKKNKISLNKSATLQGLTNGNIDFLELRTLATKVYASLILENTGETITGSSNVGSGSANAAGTIAYDNEESRQIESFLEPVSQIKSGVSSLSEIDTLLQIDSKRSFIIYVEYDIEIDLTEQQGSVSTQYVWSLSLRSVKDGESDINLSIASGGDTQASPHNFSDTAAGNTQGSGTFSKDTVFKLFLSMTMSTTGSAEFDATFTVNNFKITFIDYGAQLSTLAEWYRIYSVVNKQLFLMTDNYDYLYSELLGNTLFGYDVDGCFGKMMITNGFRIRQINDANKCPSLSFDEIFKNLNAMKGIGYGFEEIRRHDAYGITDVYFRDFYGAEGLFEISGDLTSLISAGDEVSFYNNPDLFGTFTVNSISYDVYDSVTDLYLDISNQDDYFEIGSASKPDIDQLFADVYLTYSGKQTKRESLRIEDWTHFYKDYELLDLGVVEEYTEQPFNELIYDSLSISFSKYANDENQASTLEDFHTKSEWSFPNENAEKRLNLGLDWIGSTLLLNESRATLFKEKPTEAHKLDNDIFFADKVENKGFFTCSFDGTGGSESITVPQECFENIIADFPIILVQGTVSNDKYYFLTVQDAVFAPIAGTYEIPVNTVLGNTPTNESNVNCFISAFALLASTQTTYKVEADENISNTSGLTIPAYIANQRRTMKRFLLNWGRFINSILGFLTDNTPQTIRNTDYVNNGDYTASIDPYADVCEDGTHQESADISTAEFDTIKFKPNKITCSKVICDEDWDTIKKAHKNNIGVFATLNANYQLAAATAGNLGFLHDTGVFDITVKLAFGNKDSTSVFSYFFDTINGTSYGLRLTYSNSFTGFEGLFYIVFAQGSQPSITAQKNLSEYITGEVQTIRIVGKGNSTDFDLYIDGILRLSSGDWSGSVTFTAGTEGNMLIGGWSSTQSWNHVGTFESISIKNASNEEVYKYSWEQIFGINIPNIGADATDKTVARIYDLDAGDYATNFSSYNNDQNYGYFSVQSPDSDRSRTGWLLTAKRSPVNQVAVLELLERYDITFVNVGDEEIYISDVTPLADAQPITPTVSGTINKLYYYSRISGSIFWSRFGIFSDNSNPDVLLGKTNSIATGYKTGWYEVDLLTPVSVVAGTTYWLAAAMGGVNTIASESGATPSAVNISMSGTDFVTPAVVGSSLSRRNSIYAKVEI